MENRRAHQDRTILTISRLEAKRFSNNPQWIEEIRTHFITGLRKAGVPE